MISEQEVEKIIGARRIHATSFRDHLATSVADAGGMIAEKLGARAEDASQLRTLGERLARFQMEVQTAHSREELAGVASKTLAYVKWLKVMESKGNTHFEGKSAVDLDEVRDLAREAARGTRLKSDDVNLLLARSKEIAEMPFVFYAATVLGHRVTEFRDAFNKALAQIDRRTRAEWVGRTN